MNDAERIAYWATITDLPTAVGEFIGNSEFVGTDPYYRELNDALWAMLERAYAAATGYLEQAKEIERLTAEVRMLRAADAIIRTGGY